MEFKDYYSILGVSSDADDKDIKKTYKKLAKKYHPDLNQGNEKSELKFKEVNEAYHAISDPEKRKKYDELRQNYNQWQSRGGRGNFDYSQWQDSSGDGMHTRNMSPEEFSNIFGNSGYGGMNSEGGDFSDFFSTIFGRGQRGGRQSSPHFAGYNNQSTPGRDVEGEAVISLEEAYQGTKRIIDIGNRRIEAKISKGVKDGSKLRIVGQGEEGNFGGQKGNLYLKIRISSHPIFERNEDNLAIVLPVDFFTAVLGGEVKVRTLAGEILLKIPPKTQTGKSFRLKGKGMPIMNQENKYGDLIAKISIVLPEKISEHESSILKELAEKRSRH